MARRRRSRRRVPAGGEHHRGRDGAHADAAAAARPPAPAVGRRAARPVRDGAARERSIAAAKTRAAAWVDGSVAKDAAGFHVSLVEHASDDRVLASGEGASADLTDAVGESVRRVFAQAPPPASRTPLLASETTIQLEAGALLPRDDAGALSRELALSMVSARPTDALFWREADRASRGEGHVAPLFRAWAAWMPAEPKAWERFAFGNPSLDAGQRVAFVRRAYAIAPEQPLWAFKLAEALVRTGRAEEARVIAGDMMRRGPEMSAAAQGVLLRVDAGEAHFGAALARGEKLIAAMSRYGEPQDWPTMSVLLDVGLIVGKVTPIADAFARRFVLADPPPIARDVSDSRYVPDAFARVCANASREVAKACFARLGELTATTTWNRRRRS